MSTRLLHYFKITLIVFLAPSWATAQTARVQVIHNAADPSAALVDIYVNDDLALDDVAFRTATPFLDLPAGSEIVIGVAPASSETAADAIALFPVTLSDGGTFTVIASGVLDPSQFAINPNHRDRAFTLLVKESKEQADDTSLVEFFAGHAATDAPAVNIIARDVTTLATFTTYGQLTDYFSVPPAVYTIDIQASVAGTPLASYSADLSGLGGGAAAVLASGFLNPAENQNGPSFTLIAVLPDGTVLDLPTTTLPDYSARAQIIHNAADPAASVVDIYVDGTLVIDDFIFRSATPFLDLKAEEDVVIGIAGSSSTSAEDAIATIPVRLNDGGTYQIIANGVLDPTAFTPNPEGRETAFNLWVADAREFSHNNAQFQFSVVHGSTDAPGVDVLARGVGPLVEGAKYGDITGYIGVPEGEYILDINAEGTETTVASFEANLEGLNGASASVLASGFLDPGANNSGAAFTLIAVLADGTVLELPAEASPTARVQIIHNAADPGAAVVDVYLGDELAIDNFAFRSATPFIDIPANDSVVVSVAGPTSTSVDDAIASFSTIFEAGGTYGVVANGVLDPSSFSPNPDSQSTGFNLWITESRESAQDDSVVEFFIVHGATDAPTVNVIARDVATLAEGALYGDITGYIGVPASAYTVDVQVTGTDVVAATFDVNLSGLEGGTAAVLASGFLDPAANQNGPAFAIIAVLADGTVVEFPAAENAARVQIIHNSPDPDASTVDVYVNDDLALDDFRFGDATPFISLPAEEEIVIGVAPSTSTDASDAIATFPFTLPDDATLTVIASGVLNPANFAPNPDSREIAFNLIVGDGRESAAGNGTVDVLVGHGSPDAPAVDIVARGVGTLVADARYGDLTEYVSLDPGTYTIDIKLAGTESVVASYTADLSSLAGETASIIATGFLDPSSNQGGAAFGLSMVMANGETSPVVIATSVDDPSRISDFAVHGNYPNPFVGKTSISLDMPTSGTLDVRVYDITGKMVKRLRDVAVGGGTNQSVELDLTGMPSGIYVYRMVADSSRGQDAESGKLTIVQ